MEHETAARDGQYVYAIIGNAQEREWDVCGIDGQAVHTIAALADGWVSAVVSDISYPRIRPERRHLAAHRQVLKRLMEETTLLPMRFGTITDNADEVRRVLSLNGERFLAQLDRVSGKVEMGLRVRWDVPNVFGYFVDREPELRRLRDRCFGGQNHGTREEKIAIGQYFDRLLNGEREACIRRVEEIIARCCAEIKTNSCRNEREVMNLACLVERDAGGEFEAAVTEAARLFDDDFAFEYNGPWAPHNFVDVNPEL
jgi:Gas vesicle synthesis protein GvpL/GvpF